MTTTLARSTVNAEKRRRALLNVWYLVKIIRICGDEVEFETQKWELNKVRAESEVCKTKYPLLMVHGVFFRDFRAAYNAAMRKVGDPNPDFLYDFIKWAVLNSRQDEVHDDFVFTDHYEPIDASVWNADDAYQLYWSDSVLDTYLICWGTHIVEIKFYWEPTPEQIVVVIDKLGEAFITD